MPPFVTLAVGGGRVHLFSKKDWTSFHEGLAQRGRGGRGGRNRRPRTRGKESA